MSASVGRKVWIFADGEVPEAGNFPLQGHESVIILNSGNAIASCHLTIYFTDQEPVDHIEIEVEPRRVRCIRMNNSKDLQGFELPVGRQYAMLWRCSVPVVMQYGRLDTTNQPMHFYTNQAFSC